MFINYNFIENKIIFSFKFYNYNIILYIILIFKNEFKIENNKF